MFFHHVITSGKTPDWAHTVWSVFGTHCMECIAFMEGSGLERAKNNLLVRYSFKPMRTALSVFLTAKQDTHVALLHIKQGNTPFK